MEELLDGFQEFLKAAGVSHRTRAAYSTDLRNYLRHNCPSPRGPDGAAFPEITTAGVEQYFCAQSSRGVRPATLRRSLAGLRRFCDYLVTTGVLAKNPAQDVVLAIHDDLVFSEERILSIFRFLRLRSREVPPRRALRDELVMMMLMFVGFRQCHIPLITAASLYRQDGTLQVRLNGYTPVEIDGPVLGHLRAFLRRYPHEPGPLFSSSRSTKKLLAEIATGLDAQLDHRRIRRTHLWLRANPERAYALLSRIEDIHE